MIDENVDPRSPATPIPTDPPADEPEQGMALCLSGGGYRAMLFHVGALRRINELGYLHGLKRISSVSGGSIAAAVLGKAWPMLGFDNNGVAQQFVPRVEAPLRRLASRTIDVPAVLFGLLGPGRPSDYLARYYRRYLFGSSTLQDLPDDVSGPRFVINATNLQSGVLWRFSKPYAADYKVGTIPNPSFELAVAVAASSAFPPFFSPLVLHVPANSYGPMVPPPPLHYPPFTTEVILSDGGVYDNLGLETAWKRYTSVLVSDGGGRLEPSERPSSFWPLHMLRVLNVIDSQVRSRRKIQVVASYTTPPGHPGHRDGAYWSSWTDIGEYSAPDTLPCPPDKTIKLATVPARLAALSGTTQMQLINWGYAICDAALRTYLDPSLPAPQAFPYPAVGVG